ncbi:MAG: hypothetical protein JW956_01010 [Calditrichaceae bacterium]|nr:hypothetical protein [Calditrichaceae bacterium]
MFSLRSLLSKFSIFMLVIAFIFFMSACSDQSDPMSAGTQIEESNGVADLTFITQQKATNALMKLVTDAELISRSQGGELEITSGPDFELIEMIKKAPFQISAWDLGQALLKASPLSAKVLESICENTNLRDDYWMIQVLLRNSPLRKNVLDKLIEINFITQNQSFWMKEVLVASSPLPQSVMNEICNLGLLHSEKELVFAAQVGQRLNEYQYNNAGGGLEINLYIPPYSLYTDKYISMTTDDEYLIGDVYLTFGPHGTLFSPPALLNFKASGLNLTGIDPDLVDIYYDNPTTGLWELMPSESITVDIVAGYIEVKNAEFLHFSRYAIGMR